MRTRHPHPAAPHRTAAFAVDPYRIDECTFTRGQILRARALDKGRPPTRPHAVHVGDGHRRAA